MSAIAGILFIFRKDDLLAIRDFVRLDPDCNRALGDLHNGVMSNETKSIFAVKLQSARRTAIRSIAQGHLNLKLCLVFIKPISRRLVTAA